MTSSPARPCEWLLRAAGAERPRPLAAVWPLGLLLALVLLGGCAAPAFRYTRHRPPRVWIEHRPIHPVPGDEITLTAVPETAGGTAVRSLQITYVDSLGERTIAACAAAEDPCIRRVPAAVAPGERIGLGSYRASMTTTSGARVGTTSYLFQIGSDETATPGLPAGQTLAIRVPVDLNEGNRVFRVLLVADEPSYGYSANALADAEFQRDIERLVFDELLQDPAFRWRDQQLAWFAFSRTGITTPAGSGNQSRCGQRPWPGLDLHPDFTSRYASFDVIGVLHRWSDPRFRDCSGVASADATPGAKPGLSVNAMQPGAFQHELGHGLFGLSDEYREETAGRTFAGGAPRPLGLDCEYCEGGGLGRDCVSAVGDLPLLDADCFPAPEVCPSLLGDCRSPNLFASDAECRATATRAAAHPGVEMPVDADDCRLLCDGNCPCSPPSAAFWILDRRIPAAGPDGDVMAQFSALDGEQRNGAACELCIEISFCERWETGRGRTEDEARSDCASPR